MSITNIRSGTQFAAKPHMLKKNLTLAFRSLMRHKGFSALNIIGLAIGMSAFFLIYQYIRLENSYDNFDKKGDRIYRLVTDLISTAEPQHSSNTTAPMALNLKANYPEIENYVRLCTANPLIRRGENKFQEFGAVYADSSLFSIFDFPLVKGDPASALKEPFSIVLSETTAKKYFGNADPMGQTLFFEDSGYDAKVTGIMKDLPENSTIKADLFISMSTRKHFQDSMDYRWGNFSFFSYLLLKPGVNPSSLQAQLRPFMQRHIGPMLKAQQQDYILSLEKLKDTYWSTRGGMVNGSTRNVYIFSIVGLFILLIAGINFVNLTTARSTERAKEVGIRKVIGAEKFQLTRQFLGESILISLIAFVFSLGICSLLLPWFNQLAGKTVSTGIFTRPGNILTLGTIAVGIGFLAGI